MVIKKIKEKKIRVFTGISPCIKPCECYIEVYTEGKKHFIWCVNIWIWNKIAKKTQLIISLKQNMWENVFVA